MPRAKAPEKARSGQPDGTGDPASDGGLPDFEGALEELETIVARLDAGELSLADSLEAFERGIRLTRTCEAALGAAEARVAELLDEDEDDGMDPDGPPDRGGVLAADELDEDDYEDEFGDPDRDD
jgi:exodeoxyribonuclease VII small subunit